jgi:ABC-2 type transport system ATP-binding protein
MTFEEAPVRTDQLTIRYGRKTACSVISLQIEKGSVYALLGRNGAGKSSLMRCLLGQLKADHGSAFLFGRDSWKRRSALMHRVGFVPEQPDMPPEMTARQLASFCAPFYPSWDEVGFNERLRRSSIRPNARTRDLSRGQRGMLSLALALAHHPELLLLDDPTLGLDVVARKSVYDDLIGDMADRLTTVLITTHDIQGIETIADQVGILKNGELLIDRPIEEMKATFRLLRYPGSSHWAQASPTDSPNLFHTASSRRRLDSMEVVVDDFTEAKFERFRAQDGMEGAASETMSLEEILIAVTGEESEQAS